MANPTYVLVNPDTIDAPNSRTLAGGVNVQIVDGGPGSNVTVTPINNLASIANVLTGGFTTYAGSSFTSRTLTGNSSIAIFDPTGSAGNPILSVVDNTTNQQVRGYQGATLVGTRRGFRFINGANSSVTVSDNAGTDTLDVTISSSGSGSGAPTNAGYLLKTANVNLPQAINLGGLTSGILVSTVTGITSAISIMPSAILGSLAASTLAIGTMITGASSTTVATTAPGTSGFVWTSNGTGAQPTWQAGGGGSLGQTLTSIQGLSIVSGDMLLASGVDTMARLAKGANGKFLGVSGGTVDYYVLPGSLPSIGGLSMVRGGLIQGSTTATTVTQLSPSSTVGQVLASQGTGADLAWTTVANRSATFVLNTADASLPAAQDLSQRPTGLMKVTTGTGLITTASAGTDYQAPSANLTALSSVSTNGYLAYTGSNTFAERTLTGSSSVNITNGNGGTGNPVLSVIANTTQQKVGVSLAGTLIGTRQQINLIQGSNVTLTVADNSGTDSVDVTVAATGGGGGSITKGTVTFLASASPDPIAVISSVSIASGSVILLAANDPTTFPDAAVLPWKVDTYTVGVSAVAKLYGTLSADTTYNFVILN